MKKILSDVSIFTLVLLFSFLLSIQFSSLDIEEHISTIFTFAVFLISLFTSSFLYGIIASFFSVVLINYAFTYPYFAFDFISPVNAVSAFVMLTISILTGLLVTKRKEQEKELRESEKERVRANLLRAISHDLRTPLTTINSASSLLLEEKNLTPEQKKALLRGIEEDSAWLTRMVENLLSITRIGENELGIRKTQTIVDELIDSVINKFKKRHSDEAIFVSLPDEIITVNVDALLIEEVLLNLLDNAAEHATRHTRIDLIITTDENNVTFTVNDDGCGFKKESILLEPKDGDRLKNEKRFAGIGLAVCSTIIKAHGGTIIMKNNPDKGAHFSFTLERENSDEQQK